jgi:hypothetical protein
VAESDSPYSDLRAPAGKNGGNSRVINANTAANSTGRALRITNPDVDAGGATSLLVVRAGRGRRFEADVKTVADRGHRTRGSVDGLTTFFS